MGYLLSTEFLLMMELEFSLDSSANTGNSIVLLFFAAVFQPSDFWSGRVESKIVCSAWSIFEFVTVKGTSNWCDFIFSPGEA